MATKVDSNNMPVDARMADREKQNRQKAYLLARTYYSGTAEEFVEDIILDRNMEEYPDPFLQVLHPSDYQLIAAYRHKVTEVVEEYTPKTEAEQDEIEEFVEREKMRYNILRSKFVFPESLEELGVSDETIEHVNNAHFDTGYGFTQGRKINWESCQYLFNEVDIDELRRVSAYLLMDNQTLVSRRRKPKYRLINAIRFARGDSTATLDEVMDFKPLKEFKRETTIKIDGEEVEVKEGIPFDTVKERLTRIIRNNPTLPIALALANIHTATNYYHPKIANGSYNDFHGTNFAELMDGDSVDVVAHEFFHSLQDVLAIKHVAPETGWVNHKNTPDEWMPVEFGHEPLGPLSEIQSCVKEHWLKGRCEKYDTFLRGYQVKNSNEFMAVAFETYISNPEFLQEHQSDVYETIEMILKPNLLP